MQTSAVEPWSSTIPVFEKSNSSADNTGPCPWEFPSTEHSRIGRTPNNQTGHGTRTLSPAQYVFCFRPRSRKFCKLSCRGVINFTEGNEGNKASNTAGKIQSRTSLNPLSVL